MAVPFDLNTHRTTGEPATVLPEVLVFSGGATQFAVSETGTAVYGLPTGGIVGGASEHLVTVDVGGVETALAVGGQRFQHPRFSPDGRRIAYMATNIGILVYDLDTGENRPLVGADGRLPWWSRDGRYVYFRDNVSENGFRRLADGSEEAERLYRRDRLNLPLSMSLDGTQVLVMEQTTDRGWDLVIMSQDGDSVGFTDYLRADWNEVMATISPDGVRAAYVADEFGVPEVYVRSFPGAEDRVRVSVGGGTEPVWAPDASAIYYRNGSSVMRASITSGAVFSVDTPQEIFQGAWTQSPGTYPRTNWDVRADDEPFLFVSQPGAQLTEGGGRPVIRLEVVVNWFEELRQRTGS